MVWCVFSGADYVFIEHAIHVYVENGKAYLYSLKAVSTFEQSRHR